MRLISVEVKNFRLFRDQVKIGDLSSGLNIISGDNEDGKSTILQAIRAGFFERYTSKSSQTFIPYDSAVSPEVKLKFEVGGNEHTLSKIFSKRKDGEAVLSRSDGKPIEGPAAEDFVADLLGYSYAQKGSSKPELQGLSGLLWVEQGSAYQSVGLNEESHRRIQSTLDTQIGDLLGGEHGQKLFQRITGLREEFFDKRGNPKAEYRKLIDLSDRDLTKRNSLKDKLDAYQVDVDRLDRLMKRLQEYQDDNSLRKAESDLAVVEKKHLRIKEMKVKIKAAEDSLKLLESNRKLSENEWKNRSENLERLKEASDELIKIEALIKSDESEVLVSQSKIDALHTNLADSKRNLDTIESVLNGFQSQKELEKLTIEIRKSEKTLDSANQANQRLHSCQSDVDKIILTDNEIKPIENFDRNLSILREQLKAISTKIEYRLKPGKQVLLDGVALVDSGTTIVAKDAELIIENVGEFSIVPGGEDIKKLDKEVQEKDQTVQSFLKKHGVASVADAGMLMGKKKHLQSEIKQHKEILKVLAPEGLHALEESHKHLSDEYDKLKSINAPVDLSGLSFDETIKNQKDLVGSMSQSETLLSQHAKSLNALNISLASSSANADSLKKRIVTMTMYLKKEQSLTSDESLQKKVYESQKRQDNHLNNLMALKQLLDNEKPDIIASELEQAEIAADQIRKDIEHLEQQVADLRIELRARGQHGLAEELSEAEEAHAQTSLKLSQMKKKAEALDLLYKTLDGALKQAKADVAKPIISKMEPYLDQLFPGSTPSIDENLLLKGIQREGADEPFESLSIGTREQVAILVRLAYADLLAEKGIPVMVILDDALVNSDDGRRTRMKKILFQAAQRYQVIMLTCHEREYRDAGGKLFRLSDH